MAKKVPKRRKRPNIVVPPSPYGFEETVTRLLKVGPMPRATAKQARKEKKG